MSKVSIADKTFLEAALGMSNGYVLDFTNTSFAQFFDDHGVDIYEEKYAEYGMSKASRLRSFWKLGSDTEVSSSLNGLADYIAARTVAGEPEDVTEEQVAKLRGIAQMIAGGSPTPTTGAGLPVAITTEATVTKNLISIEIHDDIYSHVQRYLTTGDYFHAVEESYKVVREKLRDLTGSERSTDVFNENAQSNRHHARLFGKAAPANPAEADFFRGVGYLHLGVQFLRNEKAHTLATFVEPNLAVHYISLASLAYDLITRYVSDQTVAEIEAMVLAKRRGYSSASKFYNDFEDGKWLRGLELPAAMTSSSVRRVLKEKWLTDADFTRSFDHSNVVLMKLELVVDELTEADLDRLLELPTKDARGREQEAGLWPFLEFVQKRHPERLSSTASAWLRQQEAAQ